MTEIQARLQSSLSPNRVLQVLTDFGPARTEVWPTVSAGTFTVHDQGEGWADVTEGNRGAWERLRYDWDTAAGTVSARRLPTSAMRVRWDCSGLTAERSTSASAPPKSARPTTYVVARRPDEGRVSRNGKIRAHP